MGTVPWPMIVRRPSRLDLADERADLGRADVDADEDRFPFHLLCRPSLCCLDEVAPDQRDVVEDPEPEVDECDQVEVEAQPVADEGQQHGHDRVGEEAADEDPIVVDAVELGPDGSRGPSRAPRGSRPPSTGRTRS